MICMTDIGLCVSYAMAKARMYPSHHTHTQALGLERVPVRRLAWFCEMIEEQTSAPPM